MNPRLRAALHYSRRGWRVLPCTPDGTVLCEDATTDEAAIRTWWARWPRANIGANHVVVLDAIGNEGERILGALEEKHGKLSETRTVRTAQGRQLHFLPNGSVIPPRARRLGSHVNVLGAGQCILLPPSADERGITLEWASLVDPAPLPGWVAQILSTPETRSQKKTSEAQGRAASPGKIETAKAFLLRALEAGPLGSQQLQLEARAARISQRTLFRAKALLNIKATRSGFGRGGIWTWEFSKTASADTKAAKPQNVAANGGEGSGSLRPCVETVLSR